MQIFPWKNKLFPQSEIYMSKCCEVSTLSAAAAAAFTAQIFHHCSIGEINDPSHFPCVCSPCKNITSAP